MGASMKVNLEVIKRLEQRLSSSSLKGAIMDVPKDKPVAALIGQAIADNFDQSGPGWPPLKIRKGRPLEKSGLLKKSATTPGAQGNIYKVQGTTIEWGTNLLYASLQNNGGVVTAKNSKFLFIPISAKGMKVGPQKDKSAQKKSGLVVGKDMVFKKSVVVPARPFLTMRAVWKKRIYEYVMDRYLSIIGMRIRV